MHFHYPDSIGTDIHLIATCTDISHITTKQLAVLLFDNQDCKNGIFLDICYNHDKLFMLSIWSALHQLRSIHLKISTTLSFHSQTDGASKCTNNTVIQAICYHVGCHQPGWVKALPHICFDIINTIQSSTGPCWAFLSPCRAASPASILAIIFDTRTYSTFVYFLKYFYIFGVRENCKMCIKNFAETARPLVLGATRACGPGLQGLQCKQITTEIPKNICIQFQNGYSYLCKFSSLVNSSKGIFLRLQSTSNPRDPKP